MDYREKVAHHEAAHAVMSIRAGLGVSGGIDIDATTSVDGATGNAAVNLIGIDDSLSRAEQQLDLARNLSIICAGAASDAKISGIDPFEALHAQPSDYQCALRHANDCAIIGTHEEALYVVIEVGLAGAVRAMDCPDVWAAVKRLASAVLTAGGQLDGDQVEIFGSI